MNNRILKFRLYSSELKEFLYFDFSTISCLAESKTSASCGFLLYHSDISDHGQLGRVVNIKDIDRETIQQSTGLFDKNGKEIYEGDIVKVQNYRSHIGSHEVELCSDFELYPVEWRQCGMWNIARNDISDSSILYEVIGNIFENSELLQKT